MKTILLFLLLSNNNQVVSSETSDALVSEVKSEIAIPVDSFVKHRNGVNYIMYAFIENREQCHYILEGKSSSTDWQIIAVKEGFKSPNKIKLSYYFQDTVGTMNQRTNYRIKRVWVEKRMMISQTLATKSITESIFEIKDYDESRLFSFRNNLNHQKITVMVFDEKGNLVLSKEFLKSPDVIITTNGLEKGRYYVVIDGDGKLYPAQPIEVE